MKFKKGDKIICIDNRNMLYNYQQLEMNVEYEVIDTGKDCNGDEWVEISKFNKPLNGLYRPERFKINNLINLKLPNVITVDFKNKKCMR